MSQETTPFLATLHADATGGRMTIEWTGEQASGVTYSGASGTSVLTNEEQRLRDIFEGQLITSRLKRARADPWPSLATPLATPIAYALGAALLSIGVTLTTAPAADLSSQGIWKSTCMAAIGLAVILAGYFNARVARKTSAT